MSRIPRRRRLVFYEDDIERLQEATARHVEQASATSGFLFDVEGHPVTEVGVVEHLQVLVPMSAASFVASREVLRGVGGGEVVSVTVRGGRRGLRLERVGERTLLGTVFDRVAERARTAGETPEQILAQYQEPPTTACLLIDAEGHFVSKAGQTPGNPETLAALLAATCWVARHEVGKVLLGEEEIWGHALVGATTTVRTLEITGQVSSRGARLLITTFEPSSSPEAIEGDPVLDAPAARAVVGEIRGLLEAIRERSPPRDPPAGHSGSLAPLRPGDPPRVPPGRLEST